MTKTIALGPQNISAVLLTGDTWEPVSGLSFVKVDGLGWEDGFAFRDRNGTFTYGPLSSLRGVRTLGRVLSREEEQAEQTARH